MTNREPDQGVGALDGLRVLVVEDEMLLAMGMMDMLATFGCEVIGPAFRVHEALRLAETQAMDGAVLDVNLAGENVFPVADALAARDIPFLFTTGYGLTGLRECDCNQPMLQKPFRTQDFRRLVLNLGWARH
jgi:CheY-like chemotaxis protein